MTDDKNRIKEKFNPVEEDLDGSMPVCNRCKHHIEGFKCKAFGDNLIPLEIIEGDDDHSVPYDIQDNDLVFEPINE